MSLYSRQAASIEAKYQKTAKRILVTYQLPPGLPIGVCDGDEEPMDHLDSAFVVHKRRIVVSHYGHLSSKLGVLANFPNRNCHYCHSRCVHVTMPRQKFYGSNQRPVKLDETNNAPEVELFIFFNYFSGII